MSELEELASRLYREHLDNAGYRGLGDWKKLSPNVRDFWLKRAKTQLAKMRRVDSRAAKT